MTLIDDQEADSNDFIAIDEVLTTGTPYPIRVHCSVWEHDGGIGAEWEDVFDYTRNINNQGSFSMDGSNDEGDVVIHFTVDTDSGNGQTCDGIEPGPPAPWTPTYDALFLPGSGTQTVAWGISWDEPHDGVDTERHARPPDGGHRELRPERSAQVQRVLPAGQR